MITGPIANDTLYDIWGITTSGLLKPADAFRILSVGPEYIQTVLKTEKAVGQLRFMSAQIIPEHEISRFRKNVKEEEAAYQKSVSEYMERIMDSRDDKGGRLRSAE